MERKAVSEGSRESIRHAPAAVETNPAERSELVERLIDALEVRGVPQGAWLVDISRVRQSLQEADGLLRRLEDAIIRDASSPPRSG
jgi:hypothetical protein